jgi:hypothetical protein
VNATSRRSRRSRRLAAVAVLLAVPALSSCGVNFKAQTDQVYTPAEGANDRSGPVDVLNALIVSDQAGSGRFIAGFANNEDKEQTLTSVTGVGVDQQIQFALEEGTFSVPGYGFLQLADTDGGTVSATGDPVKPGYYVHVQLQFSDAPTVDMDVPVVAPGEDFADVTLPSSSASPSESPSESPSPSESASSGG